MEAIITLITKPFYGGNSILQWSLALILILASIFIGRRVYWVVSKIFRKITEKTETKLDDILVDMLEEPLIFCGIMVAIWFSLKVLTLTPTIEDWIGKLFFILIIFNIAWFVARTSDALIEHYIVPLTEKSDTDLDDILLPILRNAFKIIIWAVAIIIGLSNAGYDVTAIIAGFGIGGLAVAMAANNTLSNILGGIFVFTAKPFSIGEKVKVGDIVGKITKISLRTSEITDAEGKKTLIPNKIFTDSIIQNIDTQPAYACSLQLSLEQNTSPEKIQEAMKILKEIADKNENVESGAGTGIDNITTKSIDISMGYAVKKWHEEEKDTFPDEDVKIGTVKTQVNFEVIKQFKTNNIKLLNDIPQMPPMLSALQQPKQEPKETEE